MCIHFHFLRALLPNTATKANVTYFLYFLSIHRSFTTLAFSSPPPPPVLIIVLEWKPLSFTKNCTAVFFTLLIFFIPTETNVPTSSKSAVYFYLYLSSLYLFWYIPPHTQSYTHEESPLFSNMLSYVHVYRKKNHDCLLYHVPFYSLDSFSTLLVRKKPLFYDWVESRPCSLKSSHLFSHKYTQEDNIPTLSYHQHQNNDRSPP